MKPIIEVENLSKLYHLGEARSKSLRQAAEQWWNKLTGTKVPETHALQGRDFDESQRGPEPNTFWSLKDVSFKVNQGEMIGIIGRNGAGKSTLLKILSKITEPTSGRAIMRGRVASLLEVGTGFHPDLTGRENVYLNGAILGMRKREINSKFDEIISFAEVEKFMDTPVKHYSSGMYVRLAFAVAAHLDPEILLVDEVLAVGDAAFQKKCLGKMGDVAKAGKTVLFVSHNLASLQNLCPKAILLNNGAIQSNGKSSAVIAEYLQSMSETEFCATDLRQRTGSGEIRITRFHLENSAGSRIRVAQSGQDVIFIFSYTCAEKTPLKNVIMAFGIHSILDERLVVFSTSYSGQDFETIPSQGEFRCLVKKFPLAPNRYLIISRVEVNGREADFPKNGIAFLDIEQGDFYGTGRQIGERGQCSFLVQGDWGVNAVKGKET